MTRQTVVVLAAAILTACSSSTAPTGSSSSTGGTTASGPGTSGGSSTASTGSASGSSSHASSSGAISQSSTSATATSSGSTGSSTSTSTASTSGSTGTSTVASTSSGGSSTTGGSSSGGSSSGSPAGPGQSWVWVWLDYANSLTLVAQNSASFTHVSPALYQMNYSYTSGVPYFSSGPNGGVCPMAGCPNDDSTAPDDFNGLTSTQIAQQIHTAGLKAVPLIYGGAANSGTDQGISNVISDSPAGTQQAFITSLISEAQAKGYDGWNLDWESNLQASPDAPLLISFLQTAHTQFAAQGLLLTIDILASDAEQSNCSGDTGFIDLTSLGAVVDDVIIEDYWTSLGGSSTSCPTNVPDPVPCNYPSATACPSGECVASDLALMCEFLPGNAIIGLDAVPWQSNPIAGAALSMIEVYGFTGVAVWPDVNTDGPSAANDNYLFLDPGSISPAGSTWYQLLASFLTTVD